MITLNLMALCSYSDLLLENSNVGNPLWVATNKEMKQHILRQQFVSILREFLEILGIFRNKRMIMVDSTMFILNQSCVIRTYKARQRGFEAFKSWYFSETAAF